MLTQFTILAANNNQLMTAGYTRIEVWQSIDRGNSYQEITSSVVGAAHVDSIPAITTFPSGGKRLEFKIDGGTLKTVDFSSVLANWTPAQLVARINEVSPGTASVVGTMVRLSSATTGRASSVEVVTCEDGFVGYLIGIVYGTNVRPTLVTNTLAYTYTDASGSTTARYKWRFSANGVNPISSFSDYVLGSEQPLVSSSLLSIGSATFVGIDGQPVKTKILIAMDQNPQSIGGFVTASTTPLVIESGADGFMQFTILRGAKVRVAIEGTSFVREFTVPNAASFDLITVMGGAPDPFTVQVPPPFLVRRS